MTTKAELFDLSPFGGVMDHAMPDATKVDLRYVTRIAFDGTDTALVQLKESLDGFWSFKIEITNEAAHALEAAWTAFKKTEDEAEPLAA
jgi:hypothetical protein